MMRGPSNKNALHIAETLNLQNEGVSLSYINKTRYERKSMLSIINPKSKQTIENDLCTQWLLN